MIEAPNPHPSEEVRQAIGAWTSYLKTVNWEDLIGGVEPKPTGCGPVYELENPIARPGESLAIADMRKLILAEPHYHPDGVTEIYIALQGSGLVVTGGEERQVEKDSVVVMAPNTAHFTIPNEDLVFGVINIPPFKPGDYIPITETNPAVKFDEDQLERLLKKNRFGM